MYWAVGSGSQMSSSPPLLWSHLTRSAEELGLSLIGATTAEPLGERDSRALSVWQDEGHAGELGYMKRPSELLTDARNLLEGGRSLVSVIARYESRDPGPTPHGYGRVAKYAWGRDYHRVIKRLLTTFAATSVAGTSVRWRVFTDAIPLLERPYAARAGLGFIGKHTLLIRPGVGSYFVIGGVIFTAPIAEVPTPEVRGSCGSCFSCAASCPTGAIISPYRVSAPRCISYLTIEKRGAFTLEERTALGSWIFGCDICQEVCPHNHRAHKRPHEPVAGLSQSGRTGPFLSLSEIMAISSEDQFLARFAGTPLMRARREGLIRNALCVAVHQSCDEVKSQILSLLEDDSSPLVRQHALWASASLNLSPRSHLAKIVNRDPSPEVAQEWSLLAG